MPEQPRIPAAATGLEPHRIDDYVPVVGALRRLDTTAAAPEEGEETDDCENRNDRDDRHDSSI